MSKPSQPTNGQPEVKGHLSTRIAPQVRERLDVVAQALGIRPTTLASRYIESGVNAHLQQITGRTGRAE